MHKISWTDSVSFLPRPPTFAEPMRSILDVTPPLVRSASRRGRWGTLTPALDICKQAECGSSRSNQDLKDPNQRSNQDLKDRLKPGLSRSWMEPPTGHRTILLKHKIHHAVGSYSRPTPMSIGPPYRRFGALSSSNPCTRSGTVVTGVTRN